MLILIAGSLFAHSVCDHAAWTAKRLEAPVELVHAFGRREGASAPADFTGSLDADARDALLDELAQLDAQTAKLAHWRGRAILDTAKARLLEDHVSEVAPSLRNGDVVEAVADREPDAAKWSR